MVSVWLEQVCSFWSVAGVDVVVLALTGRVVLQVEGELLLDFLS